MIRALGSDSGESSSPSAVGAARRVPMLGWAMLACVAGVAVLAFLDAGRDSSTALLEFAQEQTRLAQALALHVSVQLAQARRDPHATPPATPAITSAALSRALSAVTEGLATLELPMHLRVLVRPPSGEVLTADGRNISAPEIAHALDRRDAYLKLDREQARSLGLAPRTAVVGLAHVDGGQPFGRWGIAVAASAERLRDRERWARWRLMLTVSAVGALVFIFGGIALRNQRRELHAAHALAVARLQHSQEERLHHAARAATLGTLAIGVAHEISTPLGVISGRAEQLLERVRGDERGEKAALAVLEQTEGIGRVMKALLNLARGGTPQFAPVRADDVLDAAAEMTAHKFLAAHVRLEVRPSGGHAVVLGDKRLIEHALVNLLVNACEASSLGGLVTADVVADQRLVTFSVKDEGAGISDENAKRAVEPFFTTKADRDGTGLGLAIVHEIVTSHRGRLTIERQSICGTRAEIALPTAEADDDRI